MPNLTHILTSRLSLGLAHGLTEGGGGGLAPSTLDLFVIVGQSNAEGRGDSSLSPAAPTGRYVGGGAVAALADPVGNALTGSAWPAFANEWFAQTGRGAAFVEAATGGTALIPDAAGSNWSPSGTLRAAAVTAANNAIATIGASTSTLASVYFVWAQGEQEAETINGTTITGPLYEAALEALAAYFKAQVPAMVEMLVVRTGVRNDLANGPGWADIRAAQDAACADSANLRMAYRGASSFNAAGRALMADSVHYSQAGLNTAGKCAALAGATLAVDPVVAPAPAILASQAYMDTSTATGASATNSHTTAVGTKTLVVTVGYVLLTTSAVNIPTNITFNGVAMTKATALANQMAGANATPSQRADVGIFYLTETQYGGSLSGVTANIVSNGGAGTGINSVAAYNLDAEVVPECALGTRINSTTGTTLSVTLAPGAPVVLIGTCASAGQAAAALTHTFTGLTETGDGGASNGTECGQAAFGSATVGEGLGSTITATLSATVRAAAFFVAAFRAKISGE